MLKLAGRNSSRRDIRLGLMLILSTLVLSGKDRPTAHMPTGFDQTGGCRVTGPNGLEVYGAYQFRDLCTSTPQPGLQACWQIKIVMYQPVTNWRPDYWSKEHVEVWGDSSGHFTLKAGDWTIEMVAIEEVIRQQVAWEAEQMGWRHADSGTQRIDITVGKDTLLITGSK